jgi:hypothetical protein
MRDGKSLAADLYSTDTTVAKPTILIQTPYNKNWYRLTIGKPGGQVPYDSLNYNYLTVDWRGFHGSISADSLGYDRGLDGYDLVEWIASQKWSDGKVGTWGASALGIIQFMTAKHRPPHLYGCVPIVSSYKTGYTDFYYGGDYLKEYTQMRDSLGFTPESLILAHYKHDIYWSVIENATDYPESVNVPMLLITGWYDHNRDAPLEAFYGLKTESDTSVQDEHKFIVGPWTHGGVGTLTQGELTYPNAVDTPRVVSLRFFEYYLRGAKNGYVLEPVIRYYQLGEDAWNSTDDWYSVADRTDTLYLDSGGLLSENPPASTQPDSFMYDPRNPAPSIGGIRFNPFDTSVVVGPRDQRDSVESRSDVLVYTTPLLAQELTIAGYVGAELYVSSNRLDTDISVRLTDVYPDGRSMLITEGIRRMRFRNLYSIEELMNPGEVYHVTVELQNIAYTLEPGHSARLILTSSDYPIFDINLNNGDSLYVPGDTLVAANNVYHDPGNLSMLIFKTRAPYGASELPSERSYRQSLRVETTPFRGCTTVRFSLPSNALVSLQTYDVSGRATEMLVHGLLPPGEHAVRFDGAGLPSGIYFFRLAIDGEETQVAKSLLIK